MGSRRGYRWPTGITQRKALRTAPRHQHEGEHSHRCMPATSAARVPSTARTYRPTTAMADRLMPAPYAGPAVVTLREPIGHRLASSGACVGTEETARMAGVDGRCRPAPVHRGSDPGGQDVLVRGPWASLRFRGRRWHRLFTAWFGQRRCTEIALEVGVGKLRPDDLPSIGLPGPGSSRER